MLDDRLSRYESIIVLRFSTTLMEPQINWTSFQSSQVVDGPFYCIFKSTWIYSFFSWLTIPEHIGFWQPKDKKWIASTWNASFVFWEGRFDILELNFSMFLRRCRGFREPIGTAAFQCKTARAQAYYWLFEIIGREISPCKNLQRSTCKQRLLLPRPVVSFLFQH